MNNAKVIAGTLALALTAMSMIALAPAEHSKAAVLANGETERMVVVHKNYYGPTSAEVVAAACANGGCLDI